MKQINSALANWLLSYGLIILSAFLDSFAAYMVKARFGQIESINFSSGKLFLKWLLNFIDSPMMILALVGFIIAPGLWFLALNRIQLSVGYLFLVAFHVVFILILSIGYLGEPLTIRKVGAALLLLGSIVLIYDRT
jgi:multidrug transporter EmrE-like cation transporter